jgi:hypothetical protein
MNIQLCNPVTGLVPVAWDWELEVRNVGCVALVRPRSPGRVLTLWLLPVSLTHSSRHQYRQQQTHSGSCHGNWKKRELSSNLHSPVKFKSCEERLVFRKYQILDDAECHTLHATLLLLKKAVFWDVAQFRYGVNRRFAGTYRLHLQGRSVLLWGGYSTTRWFSWLAKMATVRFPRVSFVKCATDPRPSSLWQNKQFYQYLWAVTYFPPVRILNGMRWWYFHNFRQFR